MVNIDTNVSFLQNVFLFNHGHLVIQTISKSFMFRSRLFVEKQSALTTYTHPDFYGNLLVFKELRCQIYTESVLWNIEHPEFLCF